LTITVDNYATCPVEMVSRDSLVPSGEMINTSSAILIGGGVYDNWENFCIEANRIDYNSPILGGDSVDLAYEIKKQLVQYPAYPQFRPECFIDNMEDVLPSNASDDEYRAYFKDDMELDDSTDGTINTIMRAKWRMEHHTKKSVDFNNPTPQQFREYLKACKKYGDVDGRHKDKPTLTGKPITKHGENNRRKAIKYIWVSWGVGNLWTLPKMKKWSRNFRVNAQNIITPEDIWKATHFKFTTDRDKNLLIQYHFFIGAVTGLAPEKEWVIADIDDFVDRGSYYELFTRRPKVDNKPRTILIEAELSFSSNSKCICNYIGDKKQLGIRDKWAQKGEKALFINPDTGNRWTIKELYSFLKKYGTMVFGKRFRPYDLRHFSITARAHDWGDSPRACIRLRDFGGHADLDQTMAYVNLAGKYHDNDVEWIRRAFICPSNNGRRQHDIRSPITQQKPKKGLSEQKSIEKNGRVCRDFYHFLLRFCTAIKNIKPRCGILNNLIIKNGGIIYATIYFLFNNRSVLPLRPDLCKAGGGVL